MKKRDYHVWLTPEIGDVIQRRATQQQQSFSIVMGILITRGLEAEDAGVIERHALPVLRSVLGEDQAAALEELRQSIHADIRADILEITGKQTDRLAALLVRAARSTSLAWRLIYRLIYHQYGAAIAQEWFEDERAKAGKAMASRTQTGKEIDQ